MVLRDYVEAPLQGDSVQATLVFNSDCCHQSLVGMLDEDRRDNAESELAGDR